MRSVCATLCVMIGCSSSLYSPVHNGAVSGVLIAASWNQAVCLALVDDSVRGQDHTNVTPVVRVDHPVNAVAETIQPRLSKSDVTRKRTQ